MDSAHEQELVRKSKSDINAFKELYLYYFPKIYAYVMYMVGDKDICEDIVSNTFEKAMMNILNYDYKGYSFGSWLYTIARNLVYDKSKGKSGISLELLKEVLVSSNVTEDIANAQIRKEKLLEAINNLSIRHKEIILLRYIEGFSIQEVCDITGDSTNAVKSVCKRSIKELKEIIGDSI